MSNGIKVSELFYSLQGEGMYVGVPSVFLRVFGCNFTCSGFGMPKGQTSTERFEVLPENYSAYKTLPLVKSGCDSYPAWDVRFKHLSPVIQISGIVDQIEELLPNGRFSPNTHLILTGGEPLLGWQRQYPALFDEIYTRTMNLTNVTFETNGTQEISSELRWGLQNAYNHHKLRTTFSVSPKLSVSGEKWSDAVKPEVVRSYITLPGSQLYLKFVVANADDVSEVVTAVDEYRKAGVDCPVYLMPEGGTDDNYFLNNRVVASLALEYGFRYSPRLQVDLWKNGWAT